MNLAEGEDDEDDEDEEDPPADRGGKRTHKSSGKHMHQSEAKRGRKKR